MSTQSDFVPQRNPRRRRQRLARQLLFYTLVTVLSVGALTWLRPAHAAPLANGTETPPSYLTQWGVSGSSQGEFSTPFGVAVDSVGNVYVTDAANDRIQKFSSPVAPEIDVMGNSVSIANGDTTPDPADHTDFGSALVDGSTVVRTFTISNTGNLTLTLTGDPLVDLSGDSAFSVSSQPASNSVVAGGSTTFQITFDPSTTGAVTATVSIANNDSDETPFTFVVGGSGIVPAGAALDFDGVNDRVLIPHASVLNDYATTNELTIEFWIKPQSGTRTVMAKRPAANNSGFVVETRTGSFTTDFWIRTNVNWRGISLAFTPDVWQHIVLVAKTGDALRAYKDGVLQGTTSLSGDSSFLPSTANLGLMINTQNSSDFGKGELDEVRLWSRALSEDEIQFSLECELDDTPAGLLAHYTFNQGVTLADNSSVTTLIDGSGNNNTGTLTNFALSGSASNWVAPGSPASGIPCVERPEIYVQGNGVSIAGGDTTPASADHTDFGSALMDGGVVTRTFTIRNVGTVDLTLSGSPLVALNGDGAFSVSSQPSTPIAAGGSATIQITFAPSAAGTVTATVSLANNDSNENPYTFVVGGGGIGPAAALNFDGVNDRVVIPHTESLNDYATTGELTIEYWIKPQSGTRTAMAKRPSANDSGFVIETQTGSFTTDFWIRTNIDWRGVSFAYTPDVWQHIALVAKTGDALRVYKNGALQGTTSLSGDTSFLVNTTNMALMVDTPNNNRPGKGELDEVRLWSRTLSEDEILFSLECELDDTPAGLLAHYTFNQGVALSDNSSVTTLIDSSGNNNTGTLANFALSGSASNWVAPGSPASSGPCVERPEMDIQGNGARIVANDTTPNAADHTDFGRVLLNGGAVTRTFTIRNTGNLTLTLSGSPLVSLSGDATFSVSSQPPTPIAAGESATFQISFVPTAIGPVTATVSIANDDSDENPYTFVVGGTGAPAEVSFNGGECLLADAIDAANRDAASGGCPAGNGADTITLLGDVTLTAVNNNTQGANGLPVITSPITIDGAGYTISRTATAPDFRFLLVGADGNLTLDAVTLTGGRATGSGGADRGGALYNMGTVTVTNSTFSMNSARVGGAFYNGAAAEDSNRLTVTGSTIYNNHAVGGDGGALYLAYGTVQLINSTLSHNRADFQAGAIFTWDVLTITASTLVSNTANQNGGAIYVAFNNTLTLDRSLLTGNSAASADELYSFDSTITSAHTLFGDSSKTTTEAFQSFTPGDGNIVATSNSANIALAAILNPTLADNGGPTLTHALVPGSPAIDAAGDSGWETDQRGVARPQGCSDDIGAYELDSVACPTIGVSGNGTPISNGDTTPSAVDHTNFGSVLLTDSALTRTFTLHNNGATELTGVAVSLDGSSDFVVSAQPSASIAVSGSVTFSVTFDPTSLGVVTATVNITSNSIPYAFRVQGTGVEANVQLNGTACNLNDAINAANADAAVGTCPAGNGADTITLLGDVTLTAIDNNHIYGANGLPVITSTITIDGAGYTISRTATAPDFRLLLVEADGNLSLDAVTLMGGSSTGSGGADRGGALYNRGTVTVTNSTFSMNSARLGGAISNENNRLTVIGSTLYNNHAIGGNGGAIYHNVGTVQVINSTLSQNRADLHGGAIIAFDALTITASTLVSNTADQNGGALYAFENNNLTLERSLISGNSAASADELYNYLSAITSANTLFGDSSKTNAEAFVSFDPINNNFTPSASDSVATSDGANVALAAILDTTLADNGGPTLTHALVPGSPAIDAAGDSGWETDQRGVARPQGCSDDIGAYELDSVPCPSTVSGNNVIIGNGDTTPSATDHTDFGSVLLDGSALTRTFTLHNNGATELTGVAVSLDGSGDFVVSAQPSASIAVSDSVTFSVTFAPSAPGVVTATVNITSNSSPYAFRVQGRGVEANVQLNGVVCNLIDAINAANADAAVGTCPAGNGADAITLLGDVTLTAIDNNTQGANGLPVINSTITIDGAGYTISRTATAPDFRFLLVGADGNLTLDAVTLTGGRATGSGGADQGGALYNRGTVTVTNSTFSTNSATLGGAIFNGAAAEDSNRLTVTGSTLNNNHAVDDGGALFLNYGTVQLINSTLSHNSAVSGGAILTWDVLTIRASTFVSNTANGSGGAIQVNQNNELTLERSLLTGNSAGSGDEIYTDNSTVTSAHTLFGDSSKTNAEAFSNFTPGASDSVATSDGANIALAAILNPTLADNGGPTLTHALVPGSPAIDAAGDSGWETDQRGVARPQGTADDIGAYELAQPTLTVWGNGVSIANSDITPIDHTDFGSADVNSAVVTRTFTLSNTGAAALTDVTVSLSGSGAFSVSAQPAASIAAGSNTTFSISFDPIAPGVVTATVTITSNSHPYAFDIQGIGTAQLNQGGVITQTDLLRTYNPVPQACGGTEWATHTLTPTLTNTGGTSYTDLYFEVVELRYTDENGYTPTLCNADGGQGGGAGARVTVPNSVFDDNVFDQNNSVTQAFVVGLPVRQRYRLFVNLYGQESMEPTSADARPALAQLHWEFDENGNLVNEPTRIFLPVLSR